MSSGPYYFVGGLLRHINSGSDPFDGLVLALALIFTQLIQIVSQHMAFYLATRAGAKVSFCSCVLAHISSVERSRCRSMLS